MIRRDSLKLLAAGVVGTGMALRAGPVLAAGSKTRAVFDGRFAAARAFAQSYAGALDCQRDAATLWFDVLWPHYRPNMTIAGVTTAADAMILADCARREGLVFKVSVSAGLADGLTRWSIA